MIVSEELTGEERAALRRRVREATLGALKALGGEARRDAIRDHALQQGGFSARELATPPPPEAGARHASIVEHQLSWELTNLKREGLVENPRWRVWRLAGAAAEPPPAPLAPTDGDRLAELQAMPYRAYLRTPEWRRTRAAALLRAGHRCSLDASHDRDLEAHHATYERRGEELPSDVVVLCADCHRTFHAANGRPGPRAAAAARAPRRRSLFERLLGG